MSLTLGFSPCTPRHRLHLPNRVAIAPAEPEAPRPGERIRDENAGNPEIHARTARDISGELPRVHTSEILSTCGGVALAHDAALLVCGRGLRRDSMAMKTGILGASSGAGAPGSQKTLCLASAPWM